MTNLEFAEGLRTNKFISYNNYIYGYAANSNLRFFEECENYPYIMKSGWHDDSTVLTYCHFSQQLRGRLLNTARIKEVMDSSHLPLLFRIKDKHYLIGKGFMAHVGTPTNIANSIKLLFVACINSKMRVRNIEEVRFFVSRDIYKEEYKAVLPAIRDIMVGHTGDVILTSKIEDRVGEKIPFPTVALLSDRQNYKRAVILECIEQYFR